MYRPTKACCPAWVEPSARIASPSLSWTSFTNSTRLKGVSSSMVPSSPPSLVWAVCFPHCVTAWHLFRCPFSPSFETVCSSVGMSPASPPLRREIQAPHRSADERIMSWECGTDGGKIRAWKVHELCTPTCDHHSEAELCCLAWTCLRLL